MTEASTGLDKQPTGEQFQIPSILDKIRSQTGGTPEAIRKYFDALPFKVFSGLLNELNGWYRGILKQQKMDGDGMVADGYMPPDPQDRIPLLKEAFEKATKEDTTEKCAMILGMSILTIHPYSDGNGRTSRTIFALLTNGYSGSKKDKALFAAIGGKNQDENGNHSGGNYIITLDPTIRELRDRPSLSDLIYEDMNRSAITGRFNANLPDLPIRVGFSTSDRRYNPESKLNAEEQLELGNIFGSRELAFIACINSFSDELYKKSLRRINYRGDEHYVISYRNIINDITVDDLSRLRGSFRQTRLDYVRKLMNISNREDFPDIYRQYSKRLEQWKSQN